MNVTLGKFAWNNVIRDKRSYLAYFISSMFSVFIFFSFAVSMFHPSLSVIEAGSSLFLALLCGSIVVYVFSFIFLGYSMYAFFQTRKKQFGLLTLIGAAKGQISKLIFLENMTIGFGATLFGIGFGIIFARMFLLMEEKMIKGISFPMYMPIQAILITVILFGILFFLVSICMPKIIRKKEIAELLKSDKMQEREEKHIGLALAIGAAAMVSFLALLFLPVQGFSLFQNTSAFPVVLLLLIMIFTYVFFRYVIGILLRTIKHTNLYYKKTNMLVCSSLLGKQKENAAMMFLTCILCTIAFIVMVGFTIVNERVFSDTEEKIPFAHCFIVDKETEKAKEMLLFLREELKTKQGFMEAEFELLSKNSSHQRAFISESNYNRVRTLIKGKQFQLNDGEVYLLSGNAGRKQKIQLSKSDKQELISFMPNIKVIGIDHKLLLVTGSYTKYIVVPDSVYAKLKKEKDYKKQTIFAFQLKDWKSDTETNEKILNTLSNDIELQIASGYRYTQKSYWYEVDKVSGNLMQYVAFLLSFVFMIASASLIYSRIYTNMDKDIKKYKGIVKMGLSCHELSKIAGKELFVLLLLPFAGAMLYMWCAIGAVGNLFYVSIGGTIYLYSLAFLILEIILYEFIRRVYTNKLIKEVFG